jgi:hypothetical protein
MSNYENDTNTNRPRHPLDERSYTGWIIGGAIAVAVILGIFMMTGRTDKTNTASNPPATTQTVPPATSGSGAPTQPNDPAGNVPTAPTAR